MAVWEKEKVQYRLVTRRKRISKHLFVESWSSTIHASTLGSDEYCFRVSASARFFCVCDQLNRCPMTLIILEGTASLTSLPAAWPRMSILSLCAVSSAMGLTKLTYNFDRFSVFGPWIMLTASSRGCACIMHAQKRGKIRVRLGHASRLYQGRQIEGQPQLMSNSEGYSIELRQKGPNL